MRNVRSARCITLLTTLLCLLLPDFQFAFSKGGLTLFTLNESLKENSANSPYVKSDHPRWRKK